MLKALRNIANQKMEKYNKNNPKESEKNQMFEPKRYFEMYQEMKKLTHEETLQLLLEAQDPDEKEFFEFLGNFLLQQKQRDVIERNLF